MKKALVLGISGEFGSQMATALSLVGWQIRGLMRAESKSRFKLPYETVIGDVTDKHCLDVATEDVDLVVYGVNPANYDWDNKALPWLDGVARVVEEKKLTLVFPGNVYVFDPNDGPVFDESSRKKPIQPKGVIRKAMEQRLHQSTERGAKVIILRMGDFISNSRSSWLKFLIKPYPCKTVFSTPGRTDIPHTWAYLPDACQALAVVIEKSAELPSFAEFNFEGHRLSVQEMMEVIHRVTGKPVVKKRFPWILANIASPFSNMFKGLLHVRYLWDREVLLDGGKLKNFIGNVPHTPLEQVLVNSGLLGPETTNGMSCVASKSS